MLVNQSLNYIEADIIEEPRVQDDIGNVDNVNAVQPTPEEVEIVILNLRKALSQSDKFDESQSLGYVVAVEYGLCERL